MCEPKIAMETYQKIRGHRQDFNVKYRLYPPSEGGQQKVFQHLRCDFAYEKDIIEETGIYMIHPEFLDEAGKPFPKDTQVPMEGVASMWILVPEMRKEIHRKRLSVGVKGYFMSGSRILGEVVVSEIVDLHANE